MKPTAVRVGVAAAFMMVLVGLGLRAPRTLAHDDDDDHDNNNGAQFIYAVKVLCGTGGTGATRAVAASTDIQNVRTSINVHNPNRKTVTFTKKGIPLEDGQLPTAPGERKEETLQSDWALQMGCDDIASLGARGSTGFGDVIIESKQQLDVWAVYLTGDTAGGAIVDTDVVRVPASIKGKK